MNPSYTVVPIAPAQVEQAYVLVRLADPAMSLAEWQEICSPGSHAFHDGAGPWQVSQVLVAVGPRGYLHGLSLVGRMRHGEGTRAIEVPAFLAPSAVDPHGVCAALLCALLALCREHGCERLTLSVPGSDVGAYAALCRAVESMEADIGPMALEIRPPSAAGA